MKINPEIQNMQLKNQSISLFQQLNDLIQQMDDEAYSAPLPILSGNSIGKHVRHILELYEEMINGTSGGVICYDERKRSLELESSVHAAIARSHQILKELKGLIDGPVGLKGNWTIESDHMSVLQTSVYRELAYNVEHAVHHMAIIGLALKVAYPELRVSDYFGVAASTIRYKQACAQ